MTGHITTIVAAALALACVGAHADVKEATTQAREGDLTFVSGGVGEDERTAMLGVRGDYNLRMTLAEKGSGAFVFGVRVTFSDASGRRLAQAVARGPWLFAHVPPGTYAIDAEYQGTKTTQKVRVAAGAPREVYFYFPAAAAAGEAAPAR